MNLKIGDIVTRNSHNNDIYFKVIEIRGNIAFLKGIDLRLCADSVIDDLRKESLEDAVLDDDDSILEKSREGLNLDRSEYFYLPGKVLHIDGDSDYLDRCMKFYRDLNIKAYGVKMSEGEVYHHIVEWVRDYNPDIVVITGHDSYNQRKEQSYQNSPSFIKAVKQIREYEKSQDKLIVIAGACQSNYEGLIKAGANFASSPKRINIHALDPAIIASSIALAEKNKSIDLISLIEKTKYGSDGIGGIITMGTMYVGYPR